MSTGHMYVHGLLNLLLKAPELCLPDLEWVGPQVPTSKRDPRLQEAHTV